MAEAVFRRMVQEANLQDEIIIDSAATSSWEAGNSVHPGTRQRLLKEGISVEGMYSRQLTQADGEADYLIGMDYSNIRHILEMISPSPHTKVCKLLEFVGETGDIADPWYTGDFDVTYHDIYRGCQALLAEIQTKR